MRIARRFLIKISCSEGEQAAGSWHLISLDSNILLTLLIDKRKEFSWVNASVDFIFFSKERKEEEMREMSIGIECIFEDKE